MTAPPTPDEIFAMVTEERLALADLLEGLTPEQWATPSLCAEWTVREVAGHLVAFTVSLPTVMGHLARAFGNFDRLMDSMARDVARRPTGEIVATLRARAADRFTPPLSGPEAPITDVLVHGSDIRRPLGLPHPIEAVRARLVLDRVSVGLKGFVPKGRVAGFRFEATDLDWSAGDGLLVSGPAEALVIAVCGRPAGFDDLTGDGVDLLRSRIT